MRWSAFLLQVVLAACAAPQRLQIASAQDFQQPLLAVPAPSIDRGAPPREPASATGPVSGAEGAFPAQTFGPAAPSAVELMWMEELRRRQLLEAENAALQEQLRQLTAQPPVRCVPIPPRPHAYEFVHYWQTSCGPCVDELAMIIKLARNLRQRAVQIEFIASESPVSEELAKSMFKTKGGAGLALNVRQVVLQGYPLTILRVRGGEAVFRKTGKLDEGDMRRILELVR